MTPQSIIHKAAAEGVTLALTAAGTIKASGNRGVVERWLPVLRQRKAEIIEALRPSYADRAADLRRLVDLVASANPAYWALSDIEEAVAVGMTDYDNAMMTFRALATQYGAVAH